MTGPERIVELLGDARGVAVFGSSEPRDGDAAYDDARSAGATLANAGFAVISGGYGGVMEAASRGAREGGGRAIGVTVKNFLDRAGGNRWLSHCIEEDDLFSRTRTLVAGAAGFLILPGRSGTLAEVAFLWALHRGRLLRDHPVVLSGSAWEQPYRALCGEGIVEGRAREWTWWKKSTKEALELLLKKLA